MIGGAKHHAAIDAGRVEVVAPFQYPTVIDVCAGDHGQDAEEDVERDPSGGRVVIDSDLGNS